MTLPGKVETLRFGASALMADWAFYLIFTAVPLKAIALGAGPIILGLLPAVSSTVFILSALFFGCLSDRGDRMRLARLGNVLMATGAVLLRFAPGIPYLFLFLPLVALGGGLFWPAIQAELGDRGGTAGLGRRMGWFNVAWSSGKMMGFWTAGHMTQAYGTSAPLLLALGLEVLIFLAAPFDRPRIAPAGPRIGGERMPPARVRKSYLLAAWFANMIAFGVGATLNYQFPSRLLSLGFREGDLGNFLGLVGLAQTLTFAGLGLKRGWEYRRAWLIGPLLAGMASVAALTWTTGMLAILLSAPGIGFALGAAYSASLFHSVHQEGVRGRNTGIHEALLGAGTFLLPLTGGGLAKLGGLGAPYLLCAAAFAASVVMAFVWLNPVPRAATSTGPQGTRP